VPPYDDSTLMLLAIVGLVIMSSGMVGSCGPHDNGVAQSTGRECPITTMGDPTVKLAMAGSGVMTTLRTTT
jgi:hypothetical protein